MLLSELNGATCASDRNPLRAMLVFTSVSFGGSGFQHVLISFTYPILLNLARGFSNSRIVLPKMPRRFVLTKFILRTPTTNDRTRGTPKLSRQR
jgi:hypothetical protein